MYLMVMARKGISSVQLSKEIGITQKIACPWLIRRFVDPRAKFLYVAPNQVLNVAEKFGARGRRIDGRILGVITHVP